MLAIPLIDAVNLVGMSANKKCHIHMTTPLLACYVHQKAP